MHKVKVLFVCLGNICRSPLAEGIFRQRIEERGLTNKFEVDSCGTAAYHIGKSPDSRSVLNASENGIEYAHAARQLRRNDFEEFDYILPMDDSNLEDVLGLRPAHADVKIIKIRAFDVLNKDADVPDPYYGGEQGFQEVFEILDRSVSAFIDRVE